MRQQPLHGDQEKKVARRTSAVESLSVCLCPLPGTKTPQPARHAAQVLCSQLQGPRQLKLKVPAGCKAPSSAPSFGHDPCHPFCLTSWEPKSELLLRDVLVTSGPAVPAFRLASGTERQRRELPQGWAFGVPTGFVRKLQEYCFCKNTTLPSASKAAVGARTQGRIGSCPNATLRKFVHFLLPAVTRKNSRNSQFTAKN